MDVPVRLLTLVGFLLLAGTLGCQAPNRSIELLESELRWMEDQLYSMDQQLDQANLQLASCQRNNSSLRQELATAYQGRGATGRPQIQIEPDTSGNASPNRAMVPAPAPMPSPRSEPSRGNGQEPAWPRQDNRQIVPEPQLEYPREPEVELPREASRSGRPVDVEVSRIVLNSRLTGGYDFDGKPGDEGLLVVVEPQNAAGQYVALPGDLVIEVLDPSVQGPASRLAQWQFDASETVPHLRQTLLGRGFHLQLPWPLHPPTSSKLQVIASYRTPTGTRLADRRDIRVDVVMPGPAYHSVAGAGLPDQFVPTGLEDPSILLDHASLVPPRAPVQGPIGSSPRPPQTSPAPARQAVPATATRSLVPTWSPRRR
jgi:hypothetical protein